MPNNDNQDNPREERSKKDIVMPHVHSVLEKFEDVLPKLCQEQDGQLLAEAQVKPFIEETYHDALNAIDEDCIEVFSRFMQFNVSGGRPLNRQKAFYQALEKPDCLIYILTNAIEKKTEKIDLDDFFSGFDAAWTASGAMGRDDFFGEINCFFDALDAELDAMSSIERMLYLPVALKRVFEEAVVLYDQMLDFVCSEACWDKFNERLKKHFSFLLKHHEYNAVIDFFVSGIALVISLLVYAASNINQALVSLIPLFGLAYLALLFECAPDVLAATTGIWPMVWLLMVDLDMSLMSLFEGYRKPGVPEIGEVFSQSTRTARIKAISDAYYHMLITSTVGGGIGVYFLQALTALAFSVVVVGVALPYEALRLVRDIIDYALFSLKIASALILCAPLYLGEMLFGAPPPEAAEPNKNSQGFFSSDEAEAPEPEAHNSCGV